MKLAKWMVGGALVCCLAFGQNALAQGNSQGHGHGRGHDKHGDSDDRDEDPLLLQALDHPRNVELHIHHQEIGALTRAQGAEALLDRVGMRDRGAAGERDLAGGAEMTIERSEYEKTHDNLSIGL